MDDGQAIRLIDNDRARVFRTNRTDRVERAMPAFPVDVHCVEGSSCRHACTRRMRVCVR